MEIQCCHEQNSCNSVYKAHGLNAYGLLHVNH